MSVLRSITFLALLGAMAAFNAGCGGSSTPPAAAVTPTPTGGVTTTGGSSTAPGTATLVTVGAGGTATGVDINVVSPGATSQVNAEMLGVTPVGGGGSASNSGDSIHRGTTMKIILFGAGLNGAMQVTISGPSDIAVSNIRGIKSTNGTAGVAFDAAVSGNAALGARTVLLKNTNNDETTFTGGLEVIP